jgi:hypothetical protein
VLTLLVRNSARSFASRLAGRLAFAAAALRRRSFQILVVHGFDVLHTDTSSLIRLKYGWFDVLPNKSPFFVFGFYIDRYHTANQTAGKHDHGFGK